MVLWPERMDDDGWGDGRMRRGSWTGLTLSQISFLDYSDNTPLTLSHIQPFPTSNHKALQVIHPGHEPHSLTDQNHKASSRP